MKGKIGLLVGGAVGYVLGTRAGRERYEEIVAKASALWQSSGVGAQHRNDGADTAPPETYPNAGSSSGDLGG